MDWLVCSCRDQAVNFVAMPLFSSSLAQFWLGLGLEETCQLDFLDSQWQVFLVLGFFQSCRFAKELRLAATLSNSLLEPTAWNPSFRELEIAMACHRTLHSSGGIAGFLGHLATSAGACELSDSSDTATTSSRGLAIASEDTRSPCLVSARHIHWQTASGEAQSPFLVTARHTHCVTACSKAQSNTESLPSFD